MIHAQHTATRKLSIGQTRHRVGDLGSRPSNNREGRTQREREIHTGIHLYGKDIRNKMSIGSNRRSVCALSEPDERVSGEWREREREGRTESGRQESGDDAEAGAVAVRNDESSRVNCARATLNYWLLLPKVVCKLGALTISTIITVFQASNLYFIVEI